MGYSPDRIDALAWALTTELVIERGERVRPDAFMSNRVCERRFVYWQVMERHRSSPQFQFQELITVASLKQLHSIPFGPTEVCERPKLCATLLAQI